MEELLAIMAHLRDPESGCPWDVEQTFQSIAPYTIEEAYEVADAIQRDDMDDLKDELGDLLLQVVFHARMAEEAGLFGFQDVVDAVSDKMVRRHPHVFATDIVPTAEAQNANWESIKAEERAKRKPVDKGGDGEPRPTSALDGVARALPALTRAEKIQKRAARVGFDWAEAKPVIDKVSEELEELKIEVFQHTTDNDNADKIEEELGDLLFAVANLGRHTGQDPEAALRKGNDKFERRFRLMEQDFKADGRSLKSISLEEMEAQWQAVKQRLRSDVEKP